MYARVTINFFGYARAGKRGIGCGLGNVMKTRDGEPLAGGARCLRFCLAGVRLAGQGVDAAGGSQYSTEQDRNGLLLALIQEDRNRKELLDALSELSYKKSKLANDFYHTNATAKSRSPGSGYTCRPRLPQ